MSNAPGTASSHQASALASFSLSGESGEMDLRVSVVLRGRGVAGDQGVRYSRGDSGTEEGGLMPGYLRVRGLMISCSRRGSFCQELRVERSIVAIGEMRSSVELR